MMCRNVKMLAATTVAVVLLAAGAWAQGSWTSGATTVTLDGDGTLTVSGTGAMANYTSGTGMPWNSVKSSITEIVIENGVTNIGNYAFYGCSNLTSVTIPSSVTSIGNYALYGCNKLTSVTIPSSVTSIGSYAFYNCSGLTSVTIPNSVTSIGSSAFYNCSGLTSVTIPNSVTSIGGDAFYGCTRLTSVTIGSGVTSIAAGAFRSGTSVNSLTSIVVDDDNANYSSDNGILFNKSKTALHTYPGGKQGAYTIPISVTFIGSYAFYNCTGLTSVTIPSGVTSIGSYTFYGCTGLTSVRSLAEIPPTLGASALPTSACVYVTEESVDAYMAAAGWNGVTCYYANDVRVTKWVSGSTTVALDNGTLTVSGTGAMANYTSGTGMPWNSVKSSITEIVIENGVTNIGNYAFYGCSNLTSVTIPSSVTSIGTYAFYNCSGLTSVTIPNSVTSIGDYALYGCNKLTSVTIPSSVTSIGSYAFYNCSGLTSATIPNSVTSIGSSAFYNCSGLTSVTIPNSVTSIGSSAFYNCSGLTSVTIGSGVTSIAAGAFRSGTSVNSLTSIVVDDDNANFSSDNGILFNKSKTALHTYPGGKQGAYTIPISVTSIGNYAFSYCPGLTSVTIPDGVTSIGTYAFYNCSGLTSVTIPNSVTSIGDAAFYGCTGLTSVTIPSSATSIGTSVFYGCTGLTSVTSLAEVPPNLDTYVFRGVPVASAILYVPDASVGAYKAANIWRTFGTVLGTTIVTVSFNSQSGSAVASQNIHYNGKVTEPADPTRAGFYFDGWFKEAGCVNLWDFGVDVVGAAAVTLYAKWTTIPEHAVHFDPQGGSAVSSEYVEEGKKATTPAAPTKTGYTFGGWYKEAACIDVWNFGTEITATVTLFAKWTPVTYTIAYTLDGGSVSSANPTTYNIESAAITLNNPTKTGYTFAGWTGANGTTAQTTVSIAHGSTGDKAYTANWSINSYTVTFNTNGGSGTIASQSVQYNGYVTQPADEPTRASYYFDGWFKEALCTNEWIFDVDVLGASAVTLYAGWTTIPVHEVHFDAQGGTQVTTEYVEEGQKTAAPTDPTKTGYTFGGWYKEAACIDVWNFGTEITATVTLYAKWTINTYAVTFSAGADGAIAATVDGSVITTGASVEYGKSVVFTAIPVDGYEVSGWTVDGAAVADADANTYTLSVSSAAAVVVSFGKTSSIASSDRVIPQVKPKEEATVIAPTTVLSGEFTAGPNPVSKQSGIVNFYRQGKRVSNSELRIYDATGNVINKVKISDKALNSQARRQVGSWDLKDKNGRTVSEGTYLVKGVVKTSDGKSEKVSVIVGVR